MKGYCYIFLIMIFIMLYYKNPMYCLIVIGFIIGFYLYMKYRKGSKNNGSSRFSIFRKGWSYDNNASQINDLATLFMIQQLFNDSENLHDKNTYESDEDDASDRIDIIKNEILELLLEE